MSTVRIEQVGQNKLDHVNKVLAGIGHGDAPMRAVRSAALRAAQKGKTEAGRFAAATYSINKGTFMANCKIKVETGGGAGSVTSVGISFSGSVIPLIEFDTHWGKGGGLTTTVKQSTETLAHAFAAPVYGRTQAHEHEYGTTGPVETLYGPSTGQMMQDDQISEDMSNLIAETFDKRIDHEISRLLAGIGV